MSNTIPLPEPAYTLPFPYDDELAFSVREMHAHAAAVSAAKDAEIAKLKTVMIAAAEEIHAHWDAHCDAEGYGPANLMRRLEEGIPSQYGYTAGAFEQLRERVRVLEDALRQCEFTSPPAQRPIVKEAITALREAIAAPQAEPVAWMSQGRTAVSQSIVDDMDDEERYLYPIPLYAAPVVREPLTDEQLEEIVAATGHGSALFDFARAIEEAVWKKR